ncbi:MAG: hypothetical protein AB8B55_17795 [Mariniblastus sp.]
MISPRKTRYWSKADKVRAKRLERDGRMQKTGLEKIVESKRNGLWDFLDESIRGVNSISIVAPCA